MSQSFRFVVYSLLAINNSKENLPPKKVNGRPRKTIQDIDQSKKTEDIYDAKNNNALRSKVKSRRKDDGEVFNWKD
jgi:hypothetical protein